MDKKLFKELARAGLNYRAVTIYNYNGKEETPGIMVDHDYTGMYPSREALQAAGVAAKIADKLHLHSEHRGHCTATLIYLA